MRQSVTSTASAAWGSSIICERGKGRKRPLRSRSACTVAATSQGAAPVPSQPSGITAIGTDSAMPRRIWTVSCGVAVCNGNASATRIMRARRNISGVPPWA